jgi:hypothetical protein
MLRAFSTEHTQGEGDVLACPARLFCRSSNMLIFAFVMI